jgi:hypothetical protein
MISRNQQERRVNRRENSSWRDAAPEFQGMVKAPAGSTPPADSSERCNFEAQVDTLP